MSEEVFVLLIILLSFGFVYKMAQLRNSRRERARGEARGFTQDIDHLMERMERRIESLETLLLDRAGGGSSLNPPRRVEAGAADVRLKRVQE